MWWNNITCILPWYIRHFDKCYSLLKWYYDFVSKMSFISPNIISLMRVRESQLYHSISQSTYAFCHFPWYVSMLRYYVYGMRSCVLIYDGIESVTHLHLILGCCLRISITQCTHCIHIASNNNQNLSLIPQPN